jgi:hypothetical protein
MAFADKLHKEMQVADSNSEQLNNKFQQWYENVSRPSGLTFTINSVPHRDRLVAWLWADDVQWGELFWDETALRIELYTPGSSASWEFGWEAVMGVLWAAKRSLARE